MHGGVISTKCFMQESQPVLLLSYVYQQSLVNMVCLQLMHMITIMLCTVAAGSSHCFGLQNPAMSARLPVCPPSLPLTTIPFMLSAHQPMSSSYPLCTLLEEKVCPPPSQHCILPPPSSIPPIVPPNVCKEASSHPLIFQTTQTGHGDN